MCYARGALISQELLSRVRQASRELFSQNVDLGALRLSKTHSEELLKTKSSRGGRNPSQRALVIGFRQNSFICYQRCAGPYYRLRSSHQEQKLELSDFGRAIDRLKSSCAGELAGPL